MSEFFAKYGSFLLYAAIVGLVLGVGSALLPSKYTQNYFIGGAVAAVIIVVSWALFKGFPK